MTAKSKIFRYFPQRWRARHCVPDGARCKARTRRWLAVRSKSSIRTNVRTLPGSRQLEAWLPGYRTIGRGIACTNVRLPARVTDVSRLRNRPGRSRQAARLDIDRAGNTKRRWAGNRVEADLGTKRAGWKRRTEDRDFDPASRRIAAVDHRVARLGQRDRTQHIAAAVGRIVRFDLERMRATAAFAVVEFAQAEKSSANHLWMSTHWSACEVALIVVRLQPQRAAGGRTEECFQ